MSQSQPTLSTYFVTDCSTVCMCIIPSPFGHQNYLVCLSMYAVQLLVASSYASQPTTFFIDNEQSGTGRIGKNIYIKDILETLRPLPIAPMRLTVSRSSLFDDSVSLFKQRNFDCKKPLSPS